MNDIKEIEEILTRYDMYCKLANAENTFIQWHGSNILEELVNLITQRKREAVEGFSAWLINIARTQMAKPFISADQLELGTEDNIIRHLSQTKGDKE
jgi:hypothetical protein